MTDSEEEIRRSLEGVFALYDLNFELSTENNQESQQIYRDNLNAMIDQTQKQLDELNERAEAIYQKTGMKREQLEEYSANPNNFTNQEWKALQKVKQACEKHKQEIRSRLGEEFPIKKTEKKKRKKPLRNMTKKKHWIPL